MVRTLCLEVEETRPHMLQRKVLARRNNCMTLPVERRQRASHLLFDLSSSAQLEIIKSVNRIQQDVMKVIIVSETMNFIKMIGSSLCIRHCNVAINSRFIPMNIIDSIAK